MTYGGAALIILLSAVGAVVASYAVHRFVQVETRMRHHEVGAAIFLQLGVLFAVLLAFVFSEAFSQYNEAQRAIDLECGALHGASMVASTLPKTEARNILALEARYIRLVVDRDWPSMRDRREASQSAMLAFTALMQQTSRLPVSDSAEGAVKGQLLALFAQAHSEREERLYQAANGLPNILWGILIGFSLVLMFFVTFSGVQNYFSLTLFAVTFAICVSAILIVVRLLDYPFEGALALPPTDFADTLRKVAALLHAV